MNSSWRGGLSLPLTPSPLISLQKGGFMNLSLTPSQKGGFMNLSLTPLQKGVFCEFELARCGGNLLQSISIKGGLL